MEDSVGNCLRTAFKPFASAWKMYRYVRDSPETLGSKKMHKVGAIGLYGVLVGTAIFLFYTVITHQAVFTDLIEHKSGAYEAPSIILCPLKSELYEYTAFYKHEAIKFLNLTPTEVNILARAASTNQLESSETQESLVETHSSLSPKELWKTIVTGVYFPKEYDWNEDHPSMYNYGVDFECHASTRNYPPQIDKELGIPYSANSQTSIHRFNCHRLQDRWLTDKSYCLMWNNTGSEISFSDGIFDVKETRNYWRLKPYAFSGIRMWVGSLFTDEIALTEFPYYLRKYFTYQIFKVHESKSQICQPLLQTCNKKFDKGPELKHHWLYPTVVVVAGPDIYRRDPPWNVILLREEASWWQVNRITRFVDFQIFEVFGNLVGFFVGLSALASGKVFILLLKSYIGKSQILILLQGIGILFLLAGVLYLNILDYIYAYAEDNRYLNVFNFVIPAHGLPLGQELQICPRMMSVFNKTTMEEYNISQPLLNYIGVVGLGHIPRNYIVPPVHRSKFFMWDAHTSAELGYRWHFMAIPLQKFSQDLYETRMKQIEEEYQILAAKMGINGIETPGYEVLSKFLLQPCKIIKYCYFDGKVVEDCCRHFQYTVAGTEREFPVCLELINTRGKFRQTRPGKLNGLKVLFDIEAIVQHQAPKLWYDHYFKDYTEKCKAAYNCSSEFPTEKGYWNPGDLWKVHFNHKEISMGEYVIGIGKRDFMRPGATIEYSMELTHKKKLKRMVQSSDGVVEYNCKTDYPYYEFKFLLQEMIRKRCKCHICYGLRKIPHFIGVPCCQPKLLGRCITSIDWFEFTTCTGNNRAEPIPANFTTYYTKFSPEDYVGNISSDIPMNPLLLSTTDNLCLIPDSNFAKYFAEITEERSLTSIKKTSCDAWTIFAIPLAEYNYNTSMHGNDRDTKYYGFNFYYPHIQYNDFNELDMVDPLELISLFSGAMGIVIGLNFVGAVETMFYFFWCYVQKQDKSLISATKKFYDYTLSIFVSRFGFQTKYGFSNKVESINTTIQVKSMQNVPDESISSLQVAPVNPPHGNSLDHELDNKSEESNQPNSSRIVPIKSARGLKSSGKVYHKCSSSQKQEEVQQGTEDTAKEFGFKSQVFMAVAIAIGLAFAVFASILLKNRMDLTETTTQFDMNANISLIGPPSLGICLPHSTAVQNSVFTFEHVQRYIQELANKCVFKDETVNCREVFTVFFRALEFDCALTNFSGGPGSTKIISSYDYTVELDLPHSLNIWIGDIQTIRKDNFDASLILEPGKHLEVQYQQWETINNEICALNREYKCPSCSSHDQDYCCSTESIQSFNLSTIYHEHCKSSLYKTNTILASGLIENRGTIKVAPGVKMKRIVTKEIRRTISEKFMLYTGFIDLFVGLNMANVVFAVFPFLSRCLTKTFGCQTD